MVISWVYFLFFKKIFFNRVSLCSPGCPGTCDSQALASKVLELQVCRTKPDLGTFSILYSYHIYIYKIRIFVFLILYFTLFI
jgi:hypothetical protein